MPLTVLKALRECRDYLRLASRFWREDEPSLMAAALTYYTLLSLTPLMLLLAGATGAFLSPEQVERLLLLGFQGLLGPEAASVASEVLAGADMAATRWTATAAGAAIMVYAATRVFSELQRALNMIWQGVGSFHQHSPFWVILRRHLGSFLMVVGLGVLWAAGAATSVALSALAGWLRGRHPRGLPMLEVVHLGVSWLLLAAFIAAVYRLVPRLRLRWRDVAPGAATAAALLVAAQKLLGIYLASPWIRSFYGVAGSVVVLLFWFYATWWIFFFGAEMVKATSVHLGVVRPASSRREAGPADRTGIP